MRGQDRANRREIRRFAFYPMSLHSSEVWQHYLLSLLNDMHSSGLFCLLKIPPSWLQDAEEGEPDNIQVMIRVRPNVADENDVENCVETLEVPRARVLVVSEFRL